MGKVIIGFTMSLDGFINDQNGNVKRLYPDLDTLRYAKPLQESIEKTGCTKKGRVTVPHPVRDIPIGTLRSIEKQATIRLR
jgi:hypothetical protein